MRKHKSDRLIAIITFVLLAVGLVVIYAIGPQRANFMNSAYGTEYSSNYFFLHQLLSVGLSVAAFIIAFKFPFEKLKLYSKILVFVGLGLCAALALLSVMGSSLAKCELGGCRWFNFGAVSFQPAEFLKLGLVLYLAQLTAKWKKEGKLESRDYLQPYAIVAVLALFFVVILQKDLGTGLAVLAIVLAIMYMGGIKTSVFAVIVALALVGGVVAIVSSPHRLERMTTFSGSGNSDENYHIDNAKMAIGTGGLLGVGIGNSVQATGYLPESINDSVFAVMGETFGFVGLAAVIFAFTLLLMRILKVATKSGAEESLVVVGVFAWIGAQVVVNIAAMTGLVPLTGITLPLLSYGGTSMMFIAFSLGLVCQLSCYTGREVKNESISSRRGLGGTHYAGRRSRP